MSNLLTGDFDAVLQVSGATINRLLANLHQNAVGDASQPSFPHTVQMRVGDDRAIDGVRGLAQAQVSVPRVELIHGATDRFKLGVAVRVWFVPDRGTRPLPAFISGAVHAEYRLEDIDPKCLGWSRHAADHLWFRVVDESVRFEGTADEDQSPLDAAVSIALAATPASEAANISRITHQIAVLLATRFEASPHPVSARFRRGSMRSLNVPIVGTALSLPIGLAGDPVGSIDSMEHVVLDSADWAVAVNVGYVMSLINAALAPMNAFSKTIPIHIATPWPAPDINTVYRAGVDPATVQWLPHGTFVVIKIKASGWARTNSVLADASFDVEQDVTLSFDASVERFVLAHGTPKVTVHASGIAHATVRQVVENSILAALPPMVQAACVQAQPGLDSMTTRTQDLAPQLQTLDKNASVSLDEGVFLGYGIVLRGTIQLSRRHAPSIKIEKTADQNALSAIQCWIPGGRIDRFEWTWSWAGSGAPGRAIRDDRFLLRRPPAGTSRWGMSIGATVPLPGLDGFGSVCLMLRGAQVDAVTGEWVPVQSVVRCTRFGIGMSDRINGNDRLWLLDLQGTAAQIPVPQLALVSATRQAAKSAGTAGNVLVLHIAEAWNEKLATTLLRGVQACGRYDAGLSLLVLFREGMLEAEGMQAIAEIERLGRRLGVATLVNEDVRGGWSTTLGLRTHGGHPGWAILSPEGSAVWTQHGNLDADELALALDTHLRRVGDAAPTASHSKTEVGDTVDARALITALLTEPARTHCPPPRLGSRGVGSAVVVFVQKNSMASAAAIQTIVANQERKDEQAKEVLFAVVDSEHAEQSEDFMALLGTDFAVIHDSTGQIADRLGIEVWPTTLKLDAAGMVTEITAGLDEAADRRHELLANTEAPDLEYYAAQRPRP